MKAVDCKQSYRTYFLFIERMYY